MVNEENLSFSVRYPTGRLRRKARGLIVGSLAKIEVGNKYTLIAFSVWEVRMEFSAQALKALRRNAEAAAGLSKKDSAHLLQRLGLLQKNGKPSSEFRGVFVSRVVRVKTAKATPRKSSKLKVRA